MLLTLLLSASIGAGGPIHEDESVGVVLTVSAFDNTLDNSAGLDQPPAVPGVADNAAPVQPQDAVQDKGELGWLIGITLFQILIAAPAGIVTVVMLYFLVFRGGSPGRRQIPSGGQPAAAPPAARRHDLDALRAIAMLSGIALHGAISFTPLAWPVQDCRQSDWFPLLIAALHGFRMPLFFLLSGFFTAMLWRRRGLRALLWNRLQRIFLPCMVGLATVVPTVNGVSILAMSTAPKTVRQQPVADWTYRQSDAEAGEAVTNAPGLLEQLWGLALLLMYVPFFHHLWFLWFLCWLVAGFAVYAWAADRWRWRAPRRWWLVSPARYLWLLPLTMAPQSLMGYLYPTFGADTATGLLPAPHVLLYYGIFFGFGVWYYDADDEAGQVGRGWWLTIPLGLFILLPLGLELVFGEFGFRESVPAYLRRPLANAVQVLYAWLMTFGCMGVFRRLLNRESPLMRYVSDSSYWLYVAHVPLVIAAQMAVRSWQWPAMVKFALVCVTVCTVLLFSYHTMVRYTWLGAMLNGPRTRPCRAA